MRKSRRKQIQRKQLIFVFCGILVGVFGTTIGYAALSSTLNISGSTTVMGASWDSTIDEVDSGTVSDVLNLSDAVFVDNYAVVGSASLVQKPTVTDNSVNNLQVSVTKPNDMIVMLYKFTNTGDVAMRYDSRDISTPVITSSSGNSTDVEWANNYFDFESSLFVNNGETNVYISSGDVLCPGETVYMKVVIKMLDTNTLPSSTLTISNLNAKFNFSQYNGSYSCSS